MCIYTDKMRPRIRLGITWSLEELKKLVNDENSCVCMKRSKKHVALQPIHLNDLYKAFQDILDSSINVYDPQFKGLLLAYKNPKLVSQLGTILYDSHFIHVDIEADFYIFTPKEQSVLTGVVNKKADNYIGVLVHKVFNVSIPKKEEEDNWEGNNLEVGDDVTFTIEHVDLKGKLPFIRGQILSSGTSIQHFSSTSSSHQFFNSDEELDNDNIENVKTVNENEETNKLKRPSFLTTSSDSSDEETQTVNEVVKNKKYSKPLQSEDEEEICEKQFDLKSSITTRDEDEYNPVILNGTGKSKKSSKKDKKKSLKDKQGHNEDENNTLHDDSAFSQLENMAVMENEITTKKSKKRKHENTEESGSSEPPPKIHKHKKKNKMPENKEQSNISDEGDKLFYKANEMETNFISSNSDIDNSRNSSQEEQPPKSSKKSSKHKSKLKQQIKEEKPDFPTYSDYHHEYNQTLEPECKANRTTELSQSEEDQTDVSSHNYSNNDKEVSKPNFDEFEMLTKSAKKKKRSSASKNFLAVKIKEEPVSDAEGCFSKKSKRKQKDRENIDDSLNNLDGETLETDSSPHKKKKDKEKEPIGDVSTDKFKMKQEVVVKEESNKKKKHKEGNQSASNIKQESISSDVEGTAVKKKIKTLFTE